MSLSPETQRRWQECVRRGRAALKVLRADPWADGELLLSYVIWPGPAERRLLSRRPELRERDAA